MGIGGRAKWPNHAFGSISLLSRQVFNVGHRLFHLSSICLYDIFFMSAYIFGCPDKIKGVDVMYRLICNNFYLLLKSLTVRVTIPVIVSASVYTEEFPTKTAGPAFSGPILSISGIFFSSVTTLPLLLFLFPLFPFQGVGGLHDDVIF